MSNEIVRARKQLPVKATGAKQARPQGHSEQTKPMYEQVDPSEDIIDAQWWEEEPARAQAGWKEKWDSTKDYFDTKTQAKHDKRAADKEAQRQKLNDSVDLSEAAQVALLRSNIQGAGDKYMESLRDSGILAPGFNEGDRTQKLDMMHRVYGQMMVGACLRPLSQGVKGHTVVRAASTMAAMYMLSPTFRQTVKEYTEPVRTAIKGRIDDQTRDKADASGRRAGKANAVIDERNKAVREGNVERVARGEEPLPETEHVDANKYMAKKWRQRYDDLQFRERGNREMYTAQSAGMTEVALTEQAYAKLREPDADAATITESYQSMIKHLYQQAESDGLDREEVAAASRVVLGQRMVQDPRVQVMVSGLSHGAQRMTAPVQERIAGTDRTVKIWRGSFEDQLGREQSHTRYNDPEIKDQVVGAFTMRAPMSVIDHQNAMANTMAMTMADAVARGDMQGFNDDMAAYMVGYQAKAKDFDGSGLPGTMQTRLFQSRTMLASMTSDGLDEGQKQQVYSNAYVDAIEAVHEAFPEFSKQWTEKYGENWQGFMRDAAADPSAAYQLWHAQGGSQTRPGGQRRPEAGQSAPKPEPEYQP